MIESSCPACAHQVAVLFLDAAEQPLATLAWPASADEATSMKRLPLEFVECVDCGHIYNRRFDLDEVPYTAHPNRMFNAGPQWVEHLHRVVDAIDGALPPDATVVEVGSGTGHLLESIAKRRPDCRVVGFDLNAAGAGAFEFRQEFFLPETHISELRPDVIICRHLLEHLSNPLGVLQSIAFAASQASHSLAMFLEVPLLDQAVAAGRTVDFYYEHPSQFRVSSFTRMLERSGAQIETIERQYGDEVIVALVRYRPQEAHRRSTIEAESFRTNARRASKQIERQLNELAGSGRRVAVWGGTGKAAAFMIRFGVDAERFPVVVDSDPGKVGTYVPGTGQRIRSPQELIAEPPDVVVVPMQWRVADLLEEMSALGLKPDTVLIEHQGRLIDWTRDEHPY